MVLELSSMCMNIENVNKKIEEGIKLVEKEGFNFGVQIHNSIEKDLYDKIMFYKNDIKLSVHSPVFSNYFLNLATRDFNVIKETCDKNISYLKDAGTDIFFFHGFFMTDKPILHDMKNYRKTIQAGMTEDFSLNNSFIMNPDFFNSEKFELYKKTFRANLKKIKELYPDFTITLENDFPGLGSGLQRPKEVFELIDNLWFDVGHFWVSSLLHEFDFYKISEQIIEEKNIIGVHINHNHMDKNTLKEKLKDSHDHIYLETKQNLAPLIKKLYKKGVKIFTLEIVDGNNQDIETFFKWLK